MSVEGIRAFRRKLGNGFVAGPFSKTSDPAWIEVMGHAGFDFVIIDLEHGPNSLETVQNLIRAAEVSNLLPIVRVKSDCPSMIGEVLDIGAGGIQVPQVTDRTEAERVVRHARFAPKGMRGVCRFVRSAGYSATDRFRYFEEADESVIVLQLEGLEAISNLDGILSVEGIDVLFVGPYDLSQSLGIPGRIDHPLVQEKMLEIVDRCSKWGVMTGTFADDVESAKKWIDRGVRYIGYSVDMGIFLEKSRSIVEELGRNRTQGGRS
jgi:4-hydroxy-2-oxoheptanedioate aldolase